ncbi:hypothetical protein SUGI_0235430 [Cryptomeria japonica]|uniref:CBL-interacting serine/threonine-protein kinase 20-like n=1 Tax=Cryptomeria japonica TaxID=3369 RepID=UPI002408C252|nr:CBL-interacting serine/threonine-protein kinase 20-like [Cryptomeria japonica]GLJ14543.1 hypothetical protein SUGI_0235430 [Cryptomeria japonica]
MDSELSDYELGHVIGIGTVAKVYTAKNTHSGEIFALKVVDKEKLCEEDMDKIDREITAMLWLRHPNIVRMYDVIETEKKIFLTMEYAGGGDLWKIAGKLNQDLVRKYLRQLISAMDYCHSKGFIHRDLRAENLLLDGNGNIKVSNFGLCALPSEVDSQGLVKIGRFGGRLQYTAPELLVSKDRFDGSKADIWACGIILYVILTGNFPFETSNLTDFVRNVSTGGFECPGWFPGEVNDLVSMLLVPNPRKRICLPMLQTVDWVCKGLEEEVGGHELGADLEEDEDEGVDEFRFTTNLVVGEIALRIVEIVSGAGFRVWRNDWLVKMEWVEMGRGSCLGVVVKFLELKAGLVLVEMSKTLGESEEFERFCHVLQSSITDHVLDWDV